MKSYLTLTFLAFLFLAQSCATIVGGSKYNASVVVKDYPQATISYKGTPRGSGTAFLKIARLEADRVIIEVKVKDCALQSFRFNGRAFRGWAFFGTIVGWTGLTPDGIPLPWGVVVDLAAGSLWKPIADDKNIVKTDYKNYTYVVNYTGCDTK